MAKLYAQNGKIVSKNNHIGTSQGCCCDGTPQYLGCGACDTSQYISNPNLRGVYCDINNSYYILIKINPSIMCLNIGIPFFNQCNAGEIPLRMSPNYNFWSETDPGGPLGAGRGTASLNCVNNNWTFNASYGDGGTILSPPYGGRNPGFITGSPIGYLTETYSINATLINTNSGACNVNGMTGTGTMAYTHRRFNFTTDEFGRIGYFLDRECSGTTEVTITITYEIPDCYLCNA